MRFIEQLSTASAILSLASASPIQKRGKTFSFVQNVPKTTTKTGPNALAHAYSKYGAPISANLAAAAAQDDGSVTATPQSGDSSYLCPVTIGGQTLNLDFDTGSSDLWVFSSELPASDQAGHNIYNPDDSSTAQELSGATWSISYGDGSSASGNVYDDVVEVGGTTVSSQAVELASTISSEFVSDTSTDGLLGLAFNQLNTGKSFMWLTSAMKCVIVGSNPTNAYGTPIKKSYNTFTPTDTVTVSPTQQQTFFSNAISGLDAPLFTANLNKGAPGSYNFGYIDDSEYTGSITYVDVSTSNGFWEFDASGYAVGDGDFVSETIDAIADTGTTLLLLPDDVVSAYYAQVDGASDSSSDGGYVYDCSTSLPDITLGIGGYNAVVPGDYVNYGPVTSGSSTCFGGIQSNSGIGFTIFGDIFLKSQFVVFNGDTSPQLGFAAKGAQ